MISEYVILFCCKIEEKLLNIWKCETFSLFIIAYNIGLKRSCDRREQFGKMPSWGIFRL